MVELERVVPGPIAKFDVVQTEGLNVIDRNLLGAGGAGSLVLAVAILVELETAVAVLVGTEGVGLVDLGRVGEFAICLPRGLLVSR